MIVELQDKVRKTLERFPHLKDDDKRLTATIWLNELIAMGIDEDKAREILTFYAKGQLSNHDSITRARRKLQEDHPELRGKRWEERHAMQVDVQQELGYNVGR